MNMSGPSQETTAVKSNVRLYPLILTIIIGVLASSYLFLEASRSEQSKIHSAFEKIADERIYAITYRFNDYLETLTQLKAFYESSAGVDRSQFRNFTQPLLRYQPGLRALEWIPLVNDSQREKYEASARKDGLSNYTIVERSKAGRLVKASRRAEYFPVFYVEPFKGNTAALGYDLSSDKVRNSALNLSRQTGQTIATSRIILVQETEKEFGTIVFLPVFESDSGQGFRGFALTVIRFRDAIKQAIKALTPEGVDIYLYDTTDALETKILAMVPSSPGAGAQVLDINNVNVNRQNGISRLISFAGRKYEIVVKPTAEFVESRKTWRPWFDLFAGMLITYLIVLYLRKNITRTAEIEAQVEQRTKELANQSRRYKLLMQTSKDAIHILDANGVLRECNNAFLSHLGYSEQEASSLKVMDWDAQWSPDELLQKISSLVREGQVFETRHRRKDGTVVDVEINATGFRIGDEYLIYASARDITLRKQAAEAAKTAARDWSALFDAMADGVSLHSADHTIINVNQSLCKMLGKTREELIGGKCYEFFHVMDCPLTGCPLNKTKESGRKEYLETLEPSLNRWLAISTSPIMDNAGAASQIVHTVRDITERKQAEEACELSASLLKTTLESTADGILVVNTNGQIEEFNKLFITMWQIPYDVMASRDERRTLEYASNRLKDPQGFLDAVTRLYNQPEADSFDIIELKDGSIFERYSRPQWFNDNVIGRVWSFHDVTERRKAEEALRESEEKYRSLFEESKDVVFMSSPEGRFLSINQAGVELFGYSSKEELLKIELARDLYVDSEDRKMFQTMLNKNGFVKDYQIEMKRKDGKRLIVLSTSSVVKDEKGSILAYRGIMRDITEQKKLAAQLLHAQKMEAVGQLAGGIAHDLNNVLGAIMGFTTILQMEIKEDDPARESLSYLPALTDRAAALIKNLMAFSRKQVLDIKPSSLNDIVGTIGKLLSRVIGEDIKLNLKLSDKDVVLNADVGQIEQVLINLATNARDAMPEGGTLTLRTESYEMNDNFINKHGYGKRGKYALLSVEDTGMGMDEQTMEKIFEPFFTTKAVGKGTGLGLAMVYGTIKQHNGYINVYSEPGKGTTFMLYLPAIDTEIAEKRTMDNIPPVGGAETILLVEDEAFIRIALTTLLKKLGYKVIEAEDGNDAVNEFSEHHNNIDLVLMDVIMPNKGGKEAYQEMQRIQPDVKVILMSGHGEDILKDKKIDRDGLHFISKPVSAKDISEKIREVLDKSTN